MDGVQGAKQHIRTDLLHYLNSISHYRPVDFNEAYLSLRKVGLESREDKFARLGRDVPTTLLPKDRRIHLAVKQLRGNKSINAGNCLALG